MERGDWTRTEVTLWGEPHTFYTTTLKGDGYQVQGTRDGDTWHASCRCVPIGTGYKTPGDAMTACEQEAAA